MRTVRGHEWRLEADREFPKLKAWHCLRCEMRIGWLNGDGDDPVLIDAMVVKCNKWLMIQALR
jgi:hypothetical protein